MEIRKYLLATGEISYALDVREAKGKQKHLSKSQRIKLFDNVLSNKCKADMIMSLRFNSHSFMSGINVIFSICSPCECMCFLYTNSENYPAIIYLNIAFLLLFLLFTYYWLNICSVFLLYLYV